MPGTYFQALLAPNHAHKGEVGWKHCCMQQQPLQSSRGTAQLVASCLLAAPTPGAHQLQLLLASADAWQLLLRCCGREQGSGGPLSSQSRPSSSHGPAAPALPP
jgi:hypothetical protein